MKQEEINRHWSESSSNYDRIIRDELGSFRPAAWQKQILSHFPSEKKLSVLDIGCGPGFFTIILSAKGHDVTGIDGAGGMLERARANVAAAGCGGKILEMDANRLAFPDGSFDLLVSWNVTHTLMDHAHAYAEWKRVLKPGGLLLIYDANWHFEDTVPEVQRQYLEDWKECIRVFGSDFNENTDPDALPLPAAAGPDRHPLGDLTRPDFDVGVLRAVGFRRITYTRDITGPLWDDKEKLLYRTTPMFELCAAKE